MPNRKEFAMQTTIDPVEVAKFEAMAAEWWNPSRQVQAPAHAQPVPSGLYHRARSRPSSTAI
jgi:2-polyprenyl-3-methyl-5-hydroxy-6-metoxy-1,4-benzoquinol methylase